MNYLSLPQLVTSVILFSLGIIVYLKGKNNKLNRIFFNLSLSVSVWLLFMSIAFNVKSTTTAEFLSRVCYVGIVFIPITTFHFVIEFLKIKAPRIIIPSLYALGWGLGVLMLSSNYFVSGLYCYSWGIYPKAGKYHPVFLIFLFSQAFSIIIILIQYFCKSQTSSTRKNQIKYILLACIFLAASTMDFVPVYGVSIAPLGFIFILIFTSLIAYGAIKYRTLDITIVITRTSIFVAVYSLVLGIPFALAFAGREKLLTLFGSMWWMVPLVTSTVLATVGPFIYAYVQSRAEERLFQEQKRYQTTLRQASTGMGKIKDLKKLVTLIVHIMTRTVRVEFSMVFLNDQRDKSFKLGAYRTRQERIKYRGEVAYDTAIVKTLQETQAPIVYDEIKQRAQDYEDLKLARLEAELKALDAAIVVPSFVDEKLLAILVMGNKISGKMYTSDDLAVFSILANQSALAIENAQFYEDMKMTHEQLMKAEKMATIGILADGLSHQINNRLHAMGFIAGDALDTIKLKHNLPMSLEVKEVMLDLEHALNRIESNVQQGGEIVQGLLKYSRKNDESITAVALDKLVQAALDMTQFKIKPGEMAVEQNYPHDLPPMRGNFTQLQEVFFNLIDNAYDAMMQRKQELKEPGYKPLIKISATSEVSGHLDIVFEDNGIGIKDDDKEKIFTPFFTTKLSSKKGTGLGLYVIQRLIEENHKGKVIYQSVYKQGTKVFISLPTATEVKV